MSQPREVLPGQFYLVNRRCTQRQFLLRPYDATNNAFVYCLAEAAQRFGIDVLMTAASSNHHHTVIFDRHGRCPQFVEHFHKMFARSQNCLRGRWENFWSSEEPCIVRLIDRAAVIERLVYVATNPVKDHLVDRVHHWPGVNGFVSLMAGRPLRATRPRHFFRDPGPMPPTVTLTLTIPSELGPAPAVLDELRAAVATIERDVAADRRRTGARIVGRRRILEQSWRDAPSSIEPRRNLRPRFAASDPARRVAALLNYREFLDAYRTARLRWLAGAKAVFPRGTYWLRRFASVPVASSAAPT